MKERTRFLLVLAGAWTFVLGAMAVTFLLLGADLDEAGRAALVTLLREQAASLVVAALIVLALVTILHRWLWQQYVTAAHRLAEETETILTANPSHRAPAHGGRELRKLVHTINRFAERRESLMRDVETRVAEANARIAQEKNRLAALMSELAQSVVVCNVEGRILLYNARAMQLLRAPVEGAGGRGHALVGLGRSVFAILDRDLVIHALDGLHERLKKGERGPVAHFVAAAPSGQLVRVQVAPVLGLASDGDGAGASAAGGEDGGELTGFVLMVEDITRRVESGSRRDELLQTLTQGTRASLGSIRAAVETIASFPDMDPDARARFIGIIDEEARTLSARLDETVSSFADSLTTEWPLEEMRGADLVAAAQRRVEGKVGLPCKQEDVDESVWLKVDSYSLMQGIGYLASRLKDEFSIREIRFALGVSGRHAHLDLVWTGAPIGSETTMSWQTDAMDLGGEASPLTLKQILERHDAEMWYQIDKASHREYFRIALPRARPEEAAWTAPLPAQSRPEFYDFDLFRQGAQASELDSRPLASLHYTVFDTETTGLRPSEGDEIVSVGAVRIVNGRLLEHEVFEQLVDPGRAMSPEASRITGIVDAMLEGQPRIAKVLPAFARFCEDTVLVAHNAAFDMRFLRLKEEATGVRFEHPVLDTLLLSAVVHPNLESHSLEAISERLGIRPLGRHTALGDAIVTAEIFLRLVPLLAAKGIQTLGEAREASRTTYFARVDY